jgi:Tfp pilus assembly protein PilE
MHQFNHHLLTLVLIVSSAAIAMPSYAQNVKELNRDNNDNNVISISSQNDVATEQNVQPQLGNQSDSSNKDLAANTEKSVTNRNPRIPIFSKIFPVPSMQQ